MRKHLLITLFMIAMAISACSGQNTQQSPGIEDVPGNEDPPTASALMGPWILTAYGPADAPVPAVQGVGAGLSFSEDGKVSGSSGCNGLGGEYSVEGDQLTFGEFVSTLMACEDPIMQQEEAAHRVMTGTATYKIGGGTLTITNNDNVLVFTRGTSVTATPESASLVGDWRLTSYGTADTLSSALADVSAGLTFSDDGAVTGTSGCNEFGGSYSVDGNEITFTEVVSTLMLCDTPLMGQEEAMYQVLSETAAFQIEGDTLTIMKNGQVLVLER